MKKSIIRIILTSLVILMFSALNAGAVDISIGASGWYNDWVMKNDGGTEGDTEFDPAIVFGPVLSVRFLEDWTISSIFLWGKYDMYGGGSSTAEEITRIDSDSALNFSINRYFKVFAGLKVLRFSWSDGSHNGLGPAAGFGLTIPVGGNFYILGNLSGAYIFGKHDGTDHDTGQPTSTDYNEKGFNSNLTLAYYVQAISTTISLGFRYQLFYTDYKDNTSQTNQYHHIYGVILLAVYSFQTGE